MTSMSGFRVLVPSRVVLGVRFPVLCYLLPRTFSLGSPHLTEGHARTKGIFMGTKKNKIRWTPLGLMRDSGPPHFSISLLTVDQ